ncbi:MAG: hypothetical protein D6727_04195 [Gammaproteobacteria bacterium]|nr:MAG: hypothetical protein D6727_04195 [Gammaproteobacteria bacterium]
MPERPALALLALLLPACGPVPRAAAPAPPEVRGVSSCLRISEARDFRLVDRGRVLVFGAGRDRAYLLRIAPPVMTAAGSAFLHLEGRGDQLCGFAGDSLYFGGFGERRYAVTDVQRLDAAAVALLTGEGESAGPPQPQASDEVTIEPLPESPDGGRTATGEETAP